MPATTLTTDDLAPFAEIEAAKANAMIADAIGYAKLIAPCIFDYEFEHDAAAKAVLRGAVLRWNEAGSGASSQLVALGFSQTYDTRQSRRSMFWPSEIEALQSMCDSRESGAYAIDAAPDRVEIQHADICDVNFGGQYCSCGAVLTGHAALWESPY